MCAGSIRAVSLSWNIFSLVSFPFLLGKGMWVLFADGIAAALVVPTNMNPIGAEDNMFANLIGKVPAKRVGDFGDMAGTVIYLSSKAGVSWLFHFLISRSLADMHRVICGWPLPLCRWWTSLAGQRAGVIRLRVSDMRRGGDEAKNC